MTRGAAVLRAVGLLAVLGAVLDPGCARARRPVLDVVFAGDVDALQRTHELVRIAADAPWATVTNSRPRSEQGTVTAARIRWRRR